MTCMLKYLGGSVLIFACFLVHGWTFLLYLHMEEGVRGSLGSLV